MTNTKTTKTAAAVAPAAVETKATTPVTGAVVVTDFAKDPEVVKILTALRKAAAVTDESKNRLISRMISYAFQEKRNQILSDIVPWLGRNGLKDVAAAAKWTLQTSEGGAQFFERMARGKSIVVTAIDWGMHNALTQWLKGFEPYTAFKELKAAMAAEKAASKPQQLIDAYNGEKAAAKSTAARVKAAIAGAVKASKSDRKALLEGSTAGMDMDARAAALAFLSSEETALGCLGSLLDYMSEHNLTPAMVLSRLKELNA